MQEPAACASILALLCILTTPSSIPSHARRLINKQAAASQQSSFHNTIVFASRGLTVWIAGCSDPAAGAARAEGAARACGARPASRRLGWGWAGSPRSCRCRPVTWGRKAYTFLCSAAAPGNLCSEADTIDDPPQKPLSVFRPDTASYAPYELLLTPIECMRAYAHALALSSVVALSIGDI